MFKYIIASTMTRRNASHSCKRKSLFNRTSLPYHRFIKFKEYRRLLRDIFCLKGNEAEAILVNQQSILSIPKHQLANQCRLCAKANIDVTFLYEDAEILGLPEHQLENRILLLREMGSTYISSAMLSNFKSLMHLEMGLFKAYTHIPQSVNVATKLRDRVGPVPDYVLPDRCHDEKTSVENVNIRCAASYLSWMLNIPKEEKKLLRHLALISKHKSFALLKSLFNFLYEDIGLTSDQIIQRYARANRGSVKELRQIVKNVKTYADIEFKELIRQQPIFHHLQYQNVVKVIALLKRYGYSNAAMAHTPEILLIPQEEVARRLEHFENTPDLQILKNNIKSLKMIVFFNETQMRHGYLNDINIKDFTLYPLISNRGNFKKFTTTGMNRMKGRAIGICFTDLLKLDSSEVEERLKKHPYWKYVDLNSMNETLQFLLWRFPLNDLQDNVQIILYPRKKIEETLNKFAETNQREKEKRLVLSSSQKLAWILYEIEREHGFTGDGIWKDDTLMPGQRDKNSENTDDELSDFSGSDLSADSDLSDGEETEESVENGDVNKHINV